MSDIVDLATDIAEETIAHAVSAARGPILAGISGECEQCEWWMPRLVDGRCAFCRDGRTRPPDWEPPPRPDAIPINPSEEIAAMPMPTRKIEFAGQALTCIELLAEETDQPFKTAAEQLVLRGAGSDAGPSPIALEDIHFDALLNEVRRRFEIIDLNAVNDLRDALARADAAEGKLAAAKALFA